MRLPPGRPRRHPEHPSSPQARSAAESTPVLTKCEKSRWSHATLAHEPDRRCLLALNPPFGVLGIFVVLTMCLQTTRGTRNAIHALGPRVVVVASWRAASWNWDYGLEGVCMCVCLFEPTQLRLPRHKAGSN